MENAVGVHAEDGVVQGLARLDHQGRADALVEGHGEEGLAAHPRGVKHVEPVVGGHVDDLLVAVKGQLGRGGEGLVRELLGGHLHLGLQGLHSGEILREDRGVEAHKVGVRDGIDLTERGILCEIN